MTERGVTESVVEQAALAWLEAGGWQVAHGPDIAPDMPAAERTDHGEVVLAQRLRDALLPKLISGEVRLKAADTTCARADA
jgi:type I restriction enzyme R subunit